MNIVEVRGKLKARALKALGKPSPYGVDVDLSRFKPGLGSGNLNLSEERGILESVGIDVEEKGRAGSYYQIDNIAAYYSSRVKGLKIMPLTEALREKEALAYYWKAVPVDLDKYTATAFLYEKEGYYIEVEDGVDVSTPIQTCLLLRSPSLIQNPHNIVVVGEDAKLHLVTGCTVMRENPGLHIGVSEFYVKKGGILTFTMIHSWSGGVHVRPRTVAYVEEEGAFVSHYINMAPVESIQTYPQVYLVGSEGRAYLSSILVGRGASRLDLGGGIWLDADRSSGEIVSRVLAKDESRVVARARVTGRASGVRGHVDCRGLLLSDEASIKAIPELEAKVSGVQLTHEAAIGRIAEEELIYLLARGFTEEEAKSIIVRGFLQVEVSGLPKTLTDYIARLLDSLAEAM